MSDHPTPQDGRLQWPPVNPESQMARMELPTFNQPPSDHQISVYFRDDPSLLSCNEATEPPEPEDYGRFIRRRRSFSSLSRLESPTYEISPGTPRPEDAGIDPTLINPWVRYEEVKPENDTKPPKLPKRGKGAKARRAPRRKNKNKMNDIEPEENIEGSRWPNSPKKPRSSRTITYENLASSSTLKASSPVKRASTSVAPLSTYAATSVHLPSSAVTPQDATVPHPSATKQRPAALGAMRTPTIPSDEEDEDNDEHDDNDDPDYVDGKIVDARRKGKKRKHEDDSDGAEPPTKKKKVFFCLHKNCRDPRNGKSYYAKDRRSRDRHQDVYFPERFTCLAPGCGHTTHRKDAMNDHIKEKHGNINPVPRFDERPSVWTTHWPKEFKEPSVHDPIRVHYLRSLAAGGPPTDQGPVAGPSKTKKL